MSDAKQKCCEKLRGEGRWGSLYKVQCKKTATVTREGKPYCGTHDPQAIAERHQKSREKWDAKLKAESDERKRAAAYAASRDAVVAAADAWAETRGGAADVPAELRALYDAVLAMRAAKGGA